MDQQFLLKLGLASVHVNAIQIELSKYRFATNPRGCNIHMLFQNLYQYNTAARVVQHGSHVVQSGRSCRTTRLSCRTTRSLMSYNTATHVVQHGRSCRTTRALVSGNTIADVVQHYLSVI